MKKLYIHKHVSHTNRIKHDEIKKKKKEKEEKRKRGRGGGGGGRNGGAEE